MNAVGAMGTIVAALAPSSSTTFHQELTKVPPLRDAQREVAVAAVSWSNDAEISRAFKAMGVLHSNDGRCLPLASSPVAVSKAERALRQALAPLTRAVMPTVVPVANGGVQLEWYRQGLEFEIYFGPDGSMDALFENPGAGVELEKEGDEALDLLLRWAPRLAQVSDDDVYADRTHQGPVRQFAA